MTTNEGLLRRWSRRKQAAQAALPAAAEHEAAVATAPEPSPPDLPSIESLGTTSDYTAFLQKGVAAEVQRLALQRAWQSDERIAGFRGMAEYAWDFNAPEYGRLWAADDVAKLLQAVLTPPADEPSVAVAELGVEAEPLEPVEPSQVGEAVVEPLPGLAADAAPAQKDAGVRRHGSALPT